MEEILKYIIDNIEKVEYLSSSSEYIGIDKPIHVFFNRYKLPISDNMFSSKKYLIITEDRDENYIHSYWNINDVKVENYNVPSDILTNFTNKLEEVLKNYKKEELQRKESLKQSKEKELADLLNYISY